VALEKQLADKASSEALNNVIWRERESKIRFEETSRQNFPLKGSLSGKFSILSPIAKIEWCNWANTVISLVQFEWL
jgi:hypothetical protein